MAHIVCMTEDDLIKASIKNDRMAQRQLYERYSSAMYTIAFRITNDAEEAQDVLQDAFIKIFKNLKKFRRESTLGAWIKTIVVRTALSKIKKNKPTESLEDFHTRGMHLFLFRKGYFFPSRG